MVDWKIARRRDRCSRCETAFEEGTRHVSTIAFQGDSVAREDLCSSCWEAREAGLDIFHWYTRQRRDRRSLALDLPTLEQLFLRLEGSEEPRVLELRYVIALILMRKRRLKLVRVVREPRETLVLRRPRRDETLRVAVCDFDPARMDALRTDLVRIFDGAVEDAGGEEPVSSEPAPAGSESSDR